MLAQQQSHQNISGEFQINRKQTNDLKVIPEDFSGDIEIGGADVFQHKRYVAGYDSIIQPDNSVTDRNDLSSNAPAIDATYFVR